MRKIDDLNVSTSVNEFIYILVNKWKDKCPIPKIKGKRDSKYKSELYDITCTLDIETCTVGAPKRKSKKKWRRKGKKIDGWIYSIQINVDGENCVLRYIEDFILLLEFLTSYFSLNRKSQIVFYVHNLGYEFYWLSQILAKEFGQPRSLFIKETKPLMMDFPNGISLRDSLKLFQKSLEKATENCKHKKAVGDIDHNKIHTPDMELTDEEFRYCVYDVMGLWEAIEALKKDYHYNQATIPFTNTGRVRETMNKALWEEKGWKTINIMNDMRLTKEQLYLAYKASAGGDTHANRHLAGKIHENCNSADLKSAHPAQMCRKRFPFGAPINFSGSFQDLVELSDSGKCGWVAKLTIPNFYVKYECPDPTLSISKCCGKVNVENGVTGYDNGRILGAARLTCYMDSNDFKRFRRAYDIWDENAIIVEEAFYFHLKKLPKTFVNVIMDAFRIKETVKDKNSVDYIFAKICINTFFGLCDQKQIRDEYDVEISEKGFNVEKRTWETNLLEMSEGDVKQAQKNKMPYLWGLWTASETRLDLFNLIGKVGWDNVIYWDTDSVKYRGGKNPGVDIFNRNVIKEAEEAGAYIEIDGKRIIMGVAEDEAPDFEYGYQQFVALHAKCYAAVTNKKDKDGCPYTAIESTIAGVTKKKGAEALTGKNGKPRLDRLKPGLIIKDAGGFSLTYVERNVQKCTHFKRETQTASFIIMEPRRFEILDHVLKNKTLHDKLEIDSYII